MSGLGAAAPTAEHRPTDPKLLAAAAAQAQISPMSAPTNEPKTARLAVRLSPELAEKVEDFRFANDLESRAEALRQLLEAGLSSGAKRGAVAEPVERAAGVIARSPQGRVLMVRSLQGWSWPSLDECGPRVRGLMEGGDDDVFTVDVADEFLPRLDGQHSGFAWCSEEAALELPGPEEEEPEAEEEEVDPRLAKVLADNVDRLETQIGLLETFEHLERLDP